MEGARCLALAERQPPQLALVLRHCAGQPLDVDDSVPSDAALEDLLWRMPLLRWFDVQIDEVRPAPGEPFFATLRGRVDAVDGRAFGGFVKQGRFVLERIPRAGASELRGQTLTLPH